LGSVANTVFVPFLKKYPLKINELKVYFSRKTKFATDPQNQPIYFGDSSKELQKVIILLEKKLRKITSYKS